MLKKLIIIGAGGHGKVVADIAKLNGYLEIAFLDDDESVKSCLGYPVLGKSDIAVKYSDADFFVAVGNSGIREKIQERLMKEGLHLVSLIHPNAVVADSVEIGKGTVIMAGVVINPDAKVGAGCIVNTGASVDHDNVVEDYAHISVGSHLAGMVHIGKRTWIGAGVVVSNNINICDDCMLGAGSVVVKDIETAGIYVGVPAKKKKS